jgi:hypothetical protein
MRHGKGKKRENRREKKKRASHTQEGAAITTKSEAVLFSPSCFLFSPDRLVLVPSNGPDRHELTIRAWLLGAAVSHRSGGAEGAHDPLQGLAHTLLHRCDAL